MKKETIRVGGMSCAACSVRIEKELKRLKGITSVYANFSSNLVTVEYDERIMDHDTVCRTIERLGYTVLVKGSPSSDRSSALKIDLFLSIALTVPILLLSMGPMFGLVLISDYTVSAFVQLIFCTAVIIAGRRFYLRGIPALIHRSPTMDTLVALGSGTAFVYSTAAVFLFLFAAIGETHLYFESASMILTLISVGKYLESRSRERTDDALRGLKGLIPENATVLVDGTERTVPINELHVGDAILIRPGERIPADSTIISGFTSVDESMLTGESMPVNKYAGESIYAGTVNTDGSVTAEVTALGDDSVLYGIIQMVEDAQCTKAPIARLADRVAARFVPAVILVALAAFLIWVAAGKDLGFAVTVMISVLVISCPCAMGLATPLAITVGTGRSAEYGILFRDAASLEHAGRIDYAIFDKTGTVTEGRPSVIGIYPKEKADEILYYASAAERYSEHPVSAAICSKYKETHDSLPDAEDFNVTVGSGVRCRIGGGAVCVGNASLMGETDISAFSQMSEDDLSSGESVVFVKVDDSILGTIVVRDTVRKTSRSAVDSLGKMGISVKMVTGDAQRAASAIGSFVGITDIVSCAKPEDKIQMVKKLQANNHYVAMIGDGINDAPALMQSDLGIAVGSGTDIAIDSADVIVMNDDIRNVPALIEIGRATLKNIKQNLFFAFCYNAVCIPIAAGVPYIFGIGLIESMPMISAAAMSLSSLSVVSNALRLKRFRPKSLQCPYE